ncbi:hypothetical protein AHiyo4_07170 [Arthrobacter sp. Hiyo4]|nr:hypothetical protein AHiyo4_07170 [Arthrobacter sp. Hiyo4]
MDSRAAVATAEALSVSFAELASALRDGTDSNCSGDADPMRRRADAFLDGLAEISRLEAKSAALKAWLAAVYADTTGPWRALPRRPRTVPGRRWPWSPRSRVP